MKILPNDRVMLLSLVNTKLRDEFSSLDEFCKSYGADKNAIEQSLKAIDYFYDEAENQFK